MTSVNYVVHTGHFLSAYRMFFRYTRTEIAYRMFFKVYTGWKHAYRTYLSTYRTILAMTCYGYIVHIMSTLYITYLSRICFINNILPCVSGIKEGSSGPV